MGNWGNREEPEYKRKRQADQQRDERAKERREIMRAIWSAIETLDRIVIEQRAAREQPNLGGVKRKNPEWPTFWAVLATSIAALATVVVTHCDTMHAIREAKTSSDQQHIDTLNALSKTDATIAETHRLADAANVQANIAAKIFSGIERPHLFVEFSGFDPISIAAWLDGKEPLQNKFWVKNYGRWPAILVGARCFELFVTDKVPEMADIGEPYYYQVSDKIIGAGEKTEDYRCGPKSSTLDFGAKVDPKRDEYIQNGYIWFIGDALYKDVSGGLHETTFCLQLWHEGAPPRQAGGIGCNHQT